MKNFIREINGFYIISIYYGDTDSMYLHKKKRDVSDKANLVGKFLCRGKNDYNSGGNFYGLFLASKKYVSTINEFGLFQQHMTFKRFNDSKQLLDRPQYFNMLEGKKQSTMLRGSWKKSFNNGIVISVKMRPCNKCKDEI